MVNIPSYNIVSFGTNENNLKIALENRIIGFSFAKVKEFIESESLLFLHCNSCIFGTATVEGELFESSDIYWSDKLYPHRFRIRSLKLLKVPIKTKELGLNEEMLKRFGPGWAFKFLFRPAPIDPDFGRLMFMNLEKLGLG